MKKKIAAAITYFEDAVRESDEIINDPEVTCSEDLMHDLLEQKGHFEVALAVLRLVEKGSKDADCDH